jgi:hypothetical protein
MASATFLLRAVDQTRAAFASVQNSLEKAHKTAKRVSVGIASFFGFSALVGGVKRLDAFLEDAEKNAKKLGLTSEDLDKLTVATDFADQAAMKLQRTAALAAASLAGAFSGSDVAAKAAQIRYQRIAEELDKIRQKTSEMYNEIDALSASPSQKFAALGDAISQLNKEIETSNASVDALKNEERRLQIAGLQKTQAEIALSVFREMDAAMAQVKKTEDDFAFSMLSETEQQIRNNEALREKGRLLLLLKERLGPAMNQIDITAATPEQIILMGDMKKRLEEYNDLLGRRKVLETDLQRLSKQAGEIIAGSFEDAIISGNKLRDTLRNLAQDLLRLVFRQQITDPLAKGIGSFLNLKLAGLAAGGPVTSGTPYIVGERGPELFVPSGSGSIVPNNRLQSSGAAGGGVTINYHIAAGVSRSELAPILESERRRLKAEIPDMVRRGGAYRAAFA